MHSAAVSPPPAGRRPDPTSDPVGWALFVNRRWPVRNGLAASADSYLESLSSDARVASCRLADGMDQARRMLDPRLDPKPWFYGGIFALANDEHVERFLDSHLFTRALVRRRDPATGTWLESLSPATRELVDRIHAALRGQLAQRS